MSRPLKDVIIFKDRECKATMDIRHYPIIICELDGTFTEGIVEYFFVQWREPMTDYAESRGERVVVIMQASNSGPPPATVRRAAGEHAAKDASTKGLLCTNIVVSNPLLRGVMTAIVWVAGQDNTNVKYFGKLDQAIVSSIKSLEAAGFTPPNIDPAAYRIPTEAE